MALDQSALLELTEVLRTADSGELMRTLLGTILQALVEPEATAHVGAGLHERTDARTTQRNGHRDKTVGPPPGTCPADPEGPQRLVLPVAAAAPPAHRRRPAPGDQASVDRGVSTRKVDDLVAALGVDTGASKSEVSRVCAALDADVHAWRTRPPTAQPFPYVFLDATYCHGRVGGGPHGKGGRVASRAVVIATGVSAEVKPLHAPPGRHHPG